MNFTVEKSVHRLLCRGAKKCSLPIRAITAIDDDDDDDVDLFDPNDPEDQNSDADLDFP